MQAVDRKNGHIDLALNQPPVASEFDHYQLAHRALPEVNFGQIDLQTPFLGQVLAAPIFISSMTGGPARAERINAVLAEACRELNLAMGVGSQRIALETRHLSGMTRSVRGAIGQQPLMANFGAINLPDLASPSELSRILDPLQADALILHLNPMQEVFQPRGDTDWVGILNCIAEVCAWCPVPVIVKEVGFGLDPVSAQRLLAAGVSFLDVAGRGGTRFDWIERELRGPDAEMPSQEAFDGWGYSTPEALKLCSPHITRSQLLASGGIRHGVDVAKALCLGASLCGVGGAILPAALESTEAAVGFLRQMILDLRTACYGSGVAGCAHLNAEQLKVINPGGLG